MGDYASQADGNLHNEQFCKLTLAEQHGWLVTRVEPDVDFYR